MQSGKQKSSLQPVVPLANIEKVGSEIVTLSLPQVFFSSALLSFNLPPFYKVYKHFYQTLPVMLFFFFYPIFSPSTFF